MLRDRAWWGEHHVPPTGALRFRIGPCHLSVQSLASEWKIAWKYDDDPLEQSLEIALEGAPIEEGDGVHRFAFSGVAEQLVLGVALADRPVVVKTLEPLHILARSEATLYVSTPVWLRLSAGAEERFLCEVPSFWPVDTWFGASTRSGELCYASRTSARLSAEELPVRPGRAVSPIHVINSGPDPLELNKISVPAPSLPLHADAEGRLWTAPLRILRGEDGELEQIEVAPDLGPSARGSELVSDPRKKEHRNVLARALGAFLG